MRYLFFGLLWLTAFSLSAQNNTASDTKVVTGSILLNEKKAPDFRKIAAELPQNWYVKVDSLNITEKTTLFSTGGVTVMLAYLDYPINPEEIQIASGISWLWKTAAQETAAQKAQLVISVMGNSAKTVELYRLFTRVAAASLSTVSSASGVYMNSEYLLISKGYYLEAARNMGRDGWPLYCWMYFGLLEDKGKSSTYTYGMSEFGWPEIEIPQSSLNIQDAHALIYEVAEKALASNGKPWTDGQQVTLGEKRKVTVRVSPAQVIREPVNTIKIEQ